MIHFAWPYLFFLLPLPWLVYRFFPQSNGKEQAALKVPFIKDFECFKKNSSLSLLKRNLLLLSLIWMALLLSAARPQWHGQPFEIPQTGRDLMLAVDLSGSMQFKDFQVNGRLVDRLTALKWIVGDFIEKRKGDRIGLILFGAHAYLQTPLTFDLATVKQLLDEAEVGLAGNETAIGDAIGLSVKQLRDSPSESRVLILLTDGNSNAGELTPEKGAEIASHVNLKIYTVAIGAKEAYIQTMFGAQRINPSQELDEETLKKVAEKTGGKYFRAYNTDELVTIYKHIDDIEAIDRDVKLFRPIDELYAWPLSAALIAGAMLSCFKRRIG